jgi:phosphohistidine phosphatase
MRLYLVQHGEAVPEDVDPARPLSPSGHADVARMASFLAAAGVRVGRIMHSGKRRAEQTAVLLSAALEPGTTPVVRPGLSPKDPTDEVAQAVTAWDQDAMLVGHLPFMAKLVSRLVAGREDAGVAAFHPGSVVCLERTEQQRWVIAWMVRPDVLPNGA